MGLRSGADDYVTKPFSLVELMARIEAQFRRASVFSNLTVNGANKTRHTIEVGDLEIDLVRRTAILDGYDLDLRTKEFDLLVHLASQPGRVFSRSQLLEGVWGEDNSGESRTIDVHVSLLRRKLEDDPSNPAHLNHGAGCWVSIPTLRNVRYRQCRLNRRCPIYAESWTSSRLEWRYATAVALPLAVGWILYFFIGWWSIAAASLVAVIAVWFLGYRQMLFFLHTANGIIRTRSIDRRNRLEIEGPPEQQRIINAVNRLADSVELTLSESNRNRRYQETILNEITVGILVVDANGILQYANPAACHTLGFDLPNRLDSPTPLASKVNIYEIKRSSHDKRDRR